MHVSSMIKLLELYNCYIFKCIRIILIFFTSFNCTKSYCFFFYCSLTYHKVVGKFLKFILSFIFHKTCNIQFKYF
ncbi:hypothetical protein EDEG_02473 [Edhazardia aedis USNM 41457]|uniref:Uncharacterized protein n=1 Tax=Edhazardia aedis (strain USNM 41457) TaxID=1003232 RepID=J8ZU35_EDHAE|nr:hypothetical protein EDEG_02473 [Edhazardia aedis USNM 41457]|eukprot:EJW03168.1 hypothetical protein EDEG_02473 [Edhazardia aedis USNM 41457]